MANIELSLLDRIIRNEGERAQNAVRRPEDVISRGGDPRKKTLLLNSRQLHLGGSFNPEQEATLMRQEIERDKERAHEREKQEYLVRQKAAQKLEEQNRKKKQVEFQKQQQEEEERRAEEEKLRELKAIEMVCLELLKRKRRDKENRNQKTLLEQGRKERLKVHSIY